MMINARIFTALGLIFLLVSLTTCRQSIAPSPVSASSPLSSSSALPAIPSLKGSEAGFTWRSVNLQGMGYVTGIVIHPSPPHDVYIRTDVGGIYRFDRQKQYWIPLTDSFSGN
ncbi:MAG: hypothetical protein SFW36_07535, partial [Leptolyngbyaceae cyanobacterium bins.59]|nr:hypothetical protein [Leptolyngbyaceae cyanobacterium bins.59]